MTWRAGVDILSFGATKNGAMSADAIVVFDRDLVEPLSYRLRRAGQTWSKMRYASAQLLAYVEDGLYLRLAAKANAVAAHLGAGLAALPDVRLVAPVEANLVFVSLPALAINRLAATGLQFGRRGQDVVRFVAHFDSTEQDADKVIALADRAIAGS
jgi:threonine aldolase